MATALRPRQQLRVLCVNQRHCVDGASAAPPRRHRRETVAVVHHAIAATPARPRPSGADAVDATSDDNEMGVLRGSDRFCRQAWIRFFSMNRHQRTVREKNEDAAAHGYWGGCCTKTGPAWWWTMYLCVDVASLAWRRLRRRNAPPPVPSFKHVDRLERRRLAFWGLITSHPGCRAS